MSEDTYKFTKDHEWVRVEEDVAYIGITKHAAEQLGDVVFIEFPEIDAAYDAGDVFCVVESVKAAVDCYIPISGTVIETNTELESANEIMNQDPEGQGWIAKIKMADPSELDGLLSAKEYAEYLKTIE